MIDGLYEFLAGIGFPDPLHPPITHLPIGLATGALIFILVAAIFKKKNYEMTARHVSILAFIFAFPTILLGVFDWIHFYNAVLFPAIQIKIVLAIALIVVLGIGIILGSEIKFRSVFMTALAALAFVAAFGLGFFGSGIIYGRGLGESRPAVSVSGEAVFNNNCRSCHADGENILQPDLPLKTSARLQNETDFIAFIRQPVPPEGVEGAMPAFPETTIDAAAAHELFSYVSAMAAGAWK